MKKSDLSVLLLENPLSYYWNGFLLADGSFHNYRLTVVLSDKDKEHVQNLAKFIKTSTRRHPNGEMLACRDVQIISQVMNKFDIQYNKTYNPPNILPSTTSDNLLSLLIGFIDGDGSIGYQYGRQTSLIRIKCHGSWKSWLLLLQEQLNLSGSKPRLNNQGYCEWNIGNQGIIQQLKRHAVNNQLPILTRKWSIVS